MKKCVIVGAMPAENIKTDGDTFVIAADAGLLNLEKCGIIPDAVIGDFDSLGSKPCGENVFVHPIEKDDTDMMLAIKKGIEEGCDVFYLYGALGGRLDHTIANIQALVYLKKHGKKGYIIGDNCTLTVLFNESAIINGKKGNTLSLFALDSSRTLITLKGLKYEAENTEISNSFPLGVSNSFEQSEAFIEVKNGTLLVYREGEPEK